MTNQTIRRRIKKAIEEKEVSNSVEVRVSCVRLKGVKRFENRVEVDRVIISIDNPKDIHLFDVLSPLDNLERDGLFLGTKFIEC